MNISKDTAKRMLANIEQQLQSLAQEQQTLNGNKGGSQEFKYGGRVKMAIGDYVPRYFPSAKELLNNTGDNWIMNPNPGGWTNRSGSWLNGVQGFGNDRYQNYFNTVKPLQLPAMSSIPRYSESSSAPIKPVAVSDTNLAKLNAKPLPTVTSSKLATMPNYQSSLTTPNKQGFNFSKGLGYAGMAANLIAGLTTRKPDKLRAQDYQNPYEAQAYASMPDQWRVDPQLNDVRNQYANYLSNVNSAANSRGEALAGYTAGMNRANDANTAIWAEKFNREQQMKLAKASMLNDQGARRAGINLQVRDMNDQNIAATRNARMQYLMAAAEQASNRYYLDEQMANQKAAQNAYFKALYAQNPYMKTWLGDPLGLDTKATATKGLAKSGLKPTYADLEFLMPEQYVPYKTKLNKIKGV